MADTDAQATEVFTDGDGDWVGLYRLYGCSPDYE